MNLALFPKGRDSPVYILLQNVRKVKVMGECYGGFTGNGAGGQKNGLTLVKGSEAPILFSKEQCGVWDAMDWVNRICGYSLMAPQSMQAFVHIL